MMGWSSYKIQTAAASDPVTVSELKTHGRIDDSNEDTLLGHYITAATELAQQYQSRQYVNATYDVTFDHFENPMRLPFAPLGSVTSITYIDQDGNSQTLGASNYTVLTSSVPGRIVAAYNILFPTTRGQEDAVTVRYVAGYGATGASVPQRIKTAILMLALDMYERREAHLEKGVEANPAAMSLLAIDRVHYSQ
jgi:uncharacterized phiE125 gp8 family phage protein